ncbi:spore germination protein [Desulfotomaculum copahuensis]|uniref:Uncharacterized protein n=1 Tax=Desulfotomaculum copahuensis TaxID=1838280 RepID=A0A1B7LJE3_9FIRM|nr:spore germination protein [Desulfotomaculum copahuensis]OAT86663.1 hypothetical protein A6M21_16520 [Desulfotomaculum copahuensis]
MAMLERIWKIISFTPPEGQPFELLAGHTPAGGGAGAEKNGGITVREEQGQTSGTKTAISGKDASPGKGQTDQIDSPEERGLSGERQGQTDTPAPAGGRPAGKRKSRPVRQKPLQKRVLGRREEQAGPPPGDRSGTGREKGAEQEQAARGRSKQPVPAVQHACAGVDGAKAGERAKVTASLKQNITCLKKLFHVPPNKDVIFREFALGTAPPVAAAAVYIDGMTDRQVQDASLLKPLMLIQPGEPAGGVSVLDMVVRHLLPGNQVDTSEEMRDVVDAVLSGSTVLLVDYCPKAIVVETKGWEHRQVERPFTEQVVRGPQEAFTETLRTNTALVRKSLHSPDLVTEFFKVGRIARTDVAMLYIEGLTNARLVNEVRRRLKRIKADFAGYSGLLEQFIEDNTYGLAPQTLATERPDRVVAGLVEGHVALITDNSPFALVVPVTFFSIFHSAEDAYVRWPYGSMLRAVRLTGLFLATFLPGFYIAVVAFHHEMIPTDLLMAISASREMVPFPSVVEVFLMEGSFELIREAGIRVPGIIGPTLGIVGALILGQAAVAAHIVSPILIIVVAVTAIGSFTIPNYSLSLSVRLIRFVYIFLGSILGIWGLVLGFFVHLHLLAGTKSFGVPFLAPLAPITGAAADVLFRGPVWAQEKRPAFLYTQIKGRQPRISRHWIDRSGSGKGGGKGAQ